MTKDGSAQFYGCWDRIVGHCRSGRPEEKFCMLKFSRKSCLGPKRGVPYRSAVVKIFLRREQVVADILMLQIMRVIRVLYI